ncbi:MAG: type II toxin-antitoxin system VapB family antitoxin [Desulfobacterota bacterium]|nr:type II toxin-antitoxin system VapB family antitoxin [Thermodesulfobacteriota bacterium]
MRTTLDIPDNLLKELFKYSQVKSKTKAVSIAIEDFIKRKRLERLASLPGTVAVEYDWEKEEQRELESETHEHKEHGK